MDELTPKRCIRLGFVGGSLTVHNEGYPEIGSGMLAFDENDLDWEQHEEDDGAHRLLALPKSEMLAIRDFLNQTLPVDHLVNRFLAWPLPESVRSDMCVVLADAGSRVGRTGTNLLTSDEARQLIEYLLGAKQPVAECTCGAPPEGDGKWGGVHSGDCPAITAGK